MNFVLTFFKRHLRMPIAMERGDRPKIKPKSKPENSEVVYWAKSVSV
jgi:hypothetical protein